MTAPAIKQYRATMKRPPYKWADSMAKVDPQFGMLIGLDWTRKARRRWLVVATIDSAIKTPLLVDEATGAAWTALDSTSLAGIVRRMVRDKWKGAR